VLAPRRWAELTAPELGESAARGDVVLLPVGAVEQHGAHLPVDTDIRLAVAAAEAVATRLGRAIVAPPVWWGLSDYHRGFPGFLTLRLETFVNLLRDLVGSMVDQGFRRIVLFVGHASNKPIAQAVVSETMHAHGVAIAQINVINQGAEAFAAVRRSETGGDFHAGELETALTMHLAPDLVHTDRAVSRPVDPVAHFGHSAGTRDMFSPGSAVLGFDLRRSFPEGVAGDATVATADTGRAVFTAIVDRAAAIVAEYHATPSHVPPQ